jgi:hypothetical protein
VLCCVVAKLNIVVSVAFSAARAGQVVFFPSLVMCRRVL